MQSPTHINPFHKQQKAIFRHDWKETAFWMVISFAICILLLTIAVCIFSTVSAVIKHFARQGEWYFSPHFNSERCICAKPQYLWMTFLFKWQYDAGHDPDDEFKDNTLTHNQLPVFLCPFSLVICRFPFVRWCGGGYGWRGHPILPTIRKQANYQKYSLFLFS